MEKDRRKKKKKRDDLPHQSGLGVMLLTIREEIVSVLITLKSNICFHSYLFRVSTAVEQWVFLAARRRKRFLLL